MNNSRVTRRAVTINYDIGDGCGDQRRLAALFFYSLHPALVVDDGSANLNEYKDIKKNIGEKNKNSFRLEE